MIDSIAWMGYILAYNGRLISIKQIEQTRALLGRDFKNAEEAYQLCL